uniref:glucosaminidase domain-containing protein n=1 Tax=uncultured Sphingomonas sp. TaxID=158754 RepID=UPI0035C949C8
MTQPPQSAVDAARLSMAKWRVPASVSLAQWAIESGWGAHSPGNNPFGMKPRKGMNDPQQMLATMEWSPLRRKLVPAQQPFRIFPSIAAAFDAHAALIATAKVYAPAFAALPDRDLFIARMAPRYATDPQYAAKLGAIIRGSDLGRFDK